MFNTILAFSLNILIPEEKTFDTDKNEDRSGKEMREKKDFFLLLKSSYRKVDQNLKDR